MGALQSSNGRFVVLEPDHLVGRSPECALFQKDRVVSSRHAVLRWTGDCWQLKDLASRNGTFLNGERIEPGREYNLSVGAMVGFGSRDAQWQLVDVSEPGPMVVSSDSVILSEHGVIAVPSTAEAGASVYRTPTGGWALERPDGAVVPLQSGTTFDVQGMSYRFVCPAEAMHTTGYPEAERELSIDRLELVFNVSGDEELVELTLRSRNESVRLGSRTHNYLLLELARARLADAAKGLSDSSCGWFATEELATRLQVSSEHIQAWIYRVRREFAASGIVDPVAIIERRKYSVRIGTKRISIMPS